MGIIKPGAKFTEWAVRDIAINRVLKSATLNFDIPRGAGKEAAADLVAFAEALDEYIGKPKDASHE